MVKHSQGASARSADETISGPLYPAGTSTPLPCPFCGGSATLAPMPNAETWWQVRCDDYRCGGTTWATLDEEQAVNVWNRRAHGEA